MIIGIHNPITIFFLIILLLEKHNKINREMNENVETYNKILKICGLLYIIGNRINTPIILKN